MGDGIFCYQAVTHPCLDNPGIIPSSLCFGHSFPCAVGTATSLATPHRDVYSPLGINSLNFHTQGQAGKKKSHILCESGATVHVKRTVALWLHQAVM